MPYQDLLAFLEPHGIGQVSKRRQEGLIVVTLARRSEVVFPFQFECHPIHLDEDSPDCPIHPDVIAAVCRRFKIDSPEIQS